MTKRLNTYYKKILGHILVIITLITISSCVLDSYSEVSDTEKNTNYNIEFNINYNISPTTKNAKQSNTAYFFIYNKVGQIISIIDESNIYWKNTINTNSNNVSKSGNFAFNCSDIPRYVVCMLNLTSDMYKRIESMSLNELKNSFNVNTSNKNYLTDFISSYNNQNNYLMTNASYINDNGDIIGETDLSKYYTDEQILDKATNIRISIQVEHVLAKVSVNIQDTPNTQGIIISESIKDRINSIQTTTGVLGEKAYGIELLGWKLNATNKYFSPIKNLSGLKNDSNLPETWNNSLEKRSHWTIDANYNSNEGIYLFNKSFIGINSPENLSLNYYSLSQIPDNKNFGHTKEENSDFCLDNTLETSNNYNINKLTHVIIKARYLSLDGTDCKNIYRYSNSLYTEDEFLNIITNQLSEYDITQNGGDGIIASNDIILTYNTNDYSNRNDVKAIVQYTGNKSFGEFSNTNLNKLLFGDNTIWIYPEGYCYYSIPIIQYKGDANKPAIYGVVRNHWYKIEVKDIKGFGHPTSYKKQIVPDILEESAINLQCNVSVYSWNNFKQDISLGEIWQ